MIKWMRHAVPLLGLLWLAILLQRGESTTTKPAEPSSSKAATKTKTTGATAANLAVCSTADDGCYQAYDEASFCTFGSDRSICPPCYKYDESYQIYVCVAKNSKAVCPKGYTDCTDIATKTAPATQTPMAPGSRGHEEGKRDGSKERNVTTSSASSSSASSVSNVTASSKHTMPQGLPLWSLLLLSVMALIVIALVVFVVMTKRMGKKMLKQRLGRGFAPCSDPRQASMEDRSTGFESMEEPGNNRPNSAYGWQGPSPGSSSNFSLCFDRNKSRPHPKSSRANNGGSKSDSSTDSDDVVSDLSDLIDSRATAVKVAATRKDRLSRMSRAYGSSHGVFSDVMYSTSIEPSSDSEWANSELTSHNSINDSQHSSSSELTSSISPRNKSAWIVLNSDDPRRSSKSSPWLYSSSSSSMSMSSPVPIL